MFSLGTVEGSADRIPASAGPAESAGEGSTGVNGPAVPATVPNGVRRQHDRGARWGHWSLSNSPGGFSVDVAIDVAGLEGLFDLDLGSAAPGCGGRAGGPCRVGTARLVGSRTSAEAFATSASRGAPDRSERPLALGRKHSARPGAVVLGHSTGGDAFDGPQPQRHGGGRKAATAEGRPPPGLCSCPPPRRTGRVRRVAKVPSSVRGRASFAQVGVGSVSATKLDTAFL